MRREQLEHVIRAAGAIADSDDVLVVGSQAILASNPEWLPELVLRSVEADVAFFGDDGSLADLVDGAIGEASMFHTTHGYYAHGVSERTAVAPAGWRDRLVPVRNDNTGQVIGWALEPHDLWVAKAVAGREHDVEFCLLAARAGIVDPAVVVERVAATDVDEAVRERAEALARTIGRGKDGHGQDPSAGGHARP